MNSIYRLSQLKQLEAESIHIFRDAISQFENPVLLYSIGKDSSVLVHLAKKAFYPGRLPFKLLHIDSTFKFREMIEFRDRFVQENDLDLIVHSNQEGIAAGVNPFTYGSRKYTDIMKTQALIQALTAGKYDAVFGGARRDEEKSRAKERIFSFRDKFNQWDPKNQRPELWNIYNGRINPGESVRIFPLSNWTELDIWQYIRLEKIQVVDLYFAKPRPIVERDGSLIMAGRPPAFGTGGNTANENRPFPHTGLLPSNRSHRIYSPHCRRDCGGNAGNQAERAFFPHH